MTQQADVVAAGCRPCQVAVGTPGRLRALLGARAMPTQQVRMLALDEADQLMSSTFRADVEAIIAELPACRQVGRLPAPGLHRLVVVCPSIHWCAWDQLVSCLPRWCGF